MRRGCLEHGERPARIAVGLEDAELDSVFCWCCLVAFADGRYGAATGEWTTDMFIEAAYTSLGGGKRGGARTRQPARGR